jgi:hypothetical protein
VAAARAAGLACLAVPGGLSAELDVSAATRVVPSLAGVTTATLAEVLAAARP